MTNKLRVFTEASGSLTSGYLINAINEAGFESIGSDICNFNHAVCLCKKFIVVPKANDPYLWNILNAKLNEAEVNVVIPSLDETMIDWAERSIELQERGITVIISPVETIKIFQDKWETFNFFKSIGIPTPPTSILPDYELIKPRLGRGSAGIFKKSEIPSFSMEGMISQKIVKGQEYTVDVLFSNKGVPVYIVPRTRKDVKDGKSTKGIVVKNDKIDEYIRKISKEIKCVGPMNFQLFETDDGFVEFIEVNPRVAGGMALSFAATENWIKAIVENCIYGKEIEPKLVNYGLKMVRYYAECFI